MQGAKHPPPPMTSAPIFHIPDPSPGSHSLCSPEDRFQDSFTNVRGLPWMFCRTGALHSYHWFFSRPNLGPGDVEIWEGVGGRGWKRGAPLSFSLFCDTSIFVGVVRCGAVQM
jgi:hypothetical protein